MLLLFAGVAAVLTVDVGAEMRSAPAPSPAAGALAGLACCSFCAGRPERSGALGGRRCRAMLPERIAAATGRLAQAFAEGLAVMRRPGDSLSCSRLVGSALAVDRARHLDRVARLRFDDSFPASFLIVMYLVVGVAVPTPGASAAFI